MARIVRQIAQLGVLHIWKKRDDLASDRKNQFLQCRRMLELLSFKGQNLPLMNVVFVLLLSYFSFCGYFEITSFYLGKSIWYVWCGLSKKFPNFSDGWTEISWEHFIINKRLPWISDVVQRLIVWILNLSERLSKAMACLIWTQN